MAGRDLRAAAARDKDFLGIDVGAMARLIQQMTSASDTIGGWLRTNGSLPPSVPRGGIHQAAAVQTWVRAQHGMLTRRRNYALTRLDRGGPPMPRVGPGGLGGGRRDTTPAGAGRHLGRYPDTPAATKAADADSAAIRGAIEKHRPIPVAVWRRLRADRDDPDYTAELYRRLGPAGTAGLIEAAGSDASRLTTIETSLGTASHHVVIGERWLRALLDKARDDGVRDDAVRVLRRADLAERTKKALDRLGLTHITRTPPHLFPAPRPPREATIERVEER